MTEAMQMVRDQLGDDAIIVATREENGGRSVRVTAAIDRVEDARPYEPVTPAAAAPAARAKKPAPATGTPPHAEAQNPVRVRVKEPAVPSDYLQYDSEEEAEDAVHEILTDTLLRHGVPGDIGDTILSTATMMGLADPQSAMKTALDHSFTFTPLPLKSPRKALMLVGAPGAGKTLATAKLAARAAMAGLKVAVCTTDTVRAGGVEQLEAFTRLLQIPLMKARGADELRARLNDARGADLTLIDTGGANPFDVDDMRRHAALLEAGTIEPVLVMAAGGDAEESAEIARCFAVLGVQRLFSTRLDVTRRLGGLIAAVGRAGIAFSDASNTPMVANGVVTLSAMSLAKLLLAREGRAGTNAAEGGATTKNLRQTG
ncbi:MAG: GTPase [Rhodospirillales bacterium]|nr:GTPase [Rhodospirillales bacterium]USO08135.1 MAG: GTPase [Rhodospirillales bacterium]